MNSAESKTSSESYRNRILRGDCIDVMRQFRSASIDFVLTDPPYLVNYASKDGRTVPNDDNDAWIKPAFAEIYRVLGWNRFCISFYAWNRTDKFFAAWRKAGFRIAGHLSFVKKYVSRRRYLAYAHENAYLLAKGSPSLPAQPIADVIEWHYSGNKLHPTQKPVSALRPLIQSFSQPGELVLDPFCGSGSTLLAAKVEGRAFAGIELDPSYFEIAQHRLRP
ncbi:MAG: DNA methyltransferase [Candidatus Acidiferrales bacterium]